MSTIDQAVQLIRQGNKKEAQKILQAAIKSNPKDVPAWFWYVETCSTDKERIQLLEVCQKMNPGNTQVAQALQTLKGKYNVSSSQPAKHIAPFQSIESDSASFTQADLHSEPFLNSYPPAEPESFRDNLFSGDTRSSFGYEEPKQPENPWEDSSEYKPFSSSDLSSDPFPQNKKKEAWEADYSDYEDTSMLSRKPKPVVKTYSTFDAWMTVMSFSDIKAYEDVLDDPEAGLGRAFTWIAIAGAVNALVVPALFLTNPQYGEVLQMPEFRQLSQSYNMSALLVLVTVIMLLVAPISSVVGLVLTGGLQNLLARMFGGTGNFSRTVYAIAAYLAPTTIAISLLTMIPIVGQCLSAPLGFYSLYMNIRALRAAHSMSTGAALGAVLAPGILVFIFACLLMMFAGSASGFAS
ncbi:MAG: YIP1 family protein [Anaerolineales bacterium]|nr:YIP1 family protein [Anaerolineales bacterium]